MDETAPIRLTDVTKRFGPTLALDGVSLAVQPGEVFGYLGPNGAGKTTTIRLVMGMLRPSSGSTAVLGHDCWRDAVRVHRVVGYVPGETAVYARLTGAQHVEYFAHLRRSGRPSGSEREDADRAATLADRLDLDLHRVATTLSRGNRQKLAIVLALMSRPQVLVLDEPTSGLDPLVQQEFHALMREHTGAGGAVLLSSHVLGEVQRVADRIGVLRRGRLVAVERLEVLAAKSLHRVRASFLDEVSADDFARLPGVRDLTVGRHTLTCSAPQQSLDAVLKRVSERAVEDFECTEADLEETFLAFYGAGGDGAA